jgi:prepilin-type N-terminal cleavage/methylation domain-containing protein
VRTVLRGQAGYTLAELLVVAAVVAFILSGMLSLLTSGSQSWVTGSNRAEAQQSTRLVLARMAQDVRTAGWDPRATSGFPSIRALAPGQTGFVISNDWNASGTIETAAPVLVNGENRGEEITYDFVSGALRRRETPVDASAVEITGAIASIQFRYLNADDVQVNNAHLTTEASTIRTVEITVTTTPDQGGSSPTTVHVTSTSRARVRNRS